MSELVYPGLGPARFYPLPTAADPFYPEKFTGEILPVTEPSGEVVARAPRDYVHSGVKLLHPVVHLHVINRKSQIYLQRRALSKDLLPGYWDTAVGGHVAYGESVGEALFREAAEELGLYDFNPIFLTDYIYDCPLEQELVNVFACVGDYDPKPNADEVSEGRYWTVKEIEECFEKSILTPNFEQEFLKVKNALFALL